MDSMSERKLCMDCANFNPFMDPPRCKKAIAEKDDLLFGRRLEPSGETAAQMRASADRCGVDAVLFDPKPATNDQPPSDFEVLTQLQHLDGKEKQQHLATLQRLRRLIFW
jgi:hypothetical protein